MEKLFCPFCGNRLSNKTLDGRSRLFCLSCQEPVYENPVPATAALVTNSLGEILLVRRAVNPGSGKWCLPGGFLEVGESPEQCVLRELAEETALKGEIERFLGVEMSHNVLYKSVLVVAYAVCAMRGEAKAGDDAMELGYFSFGQLPEIAFASHLRIIEKYSGKGAPRLPMQFGAYVITSGDHVRMAEAACRAGARILQYRDKEALAGPQIEIARRIRDLTRRSQTRFIVNDHIDLALITGADGIHLGQDDIPIREARSITPPGFLIGVSTHSLEQAGKAAADRADYIGIGPVFPTPTKSDYPAIGVSVVEQVLKRVAVPVVAIGGINLQNLGQLRDIGVRNAAMVREYQGDPFMVVQRANTILLDNGA